MQTVQSTAHDIRGVVQRLGGAFMTSEQLAAREAEAGLGPRALYFRGRAAVLGSPGPAVVTELFGIFPAWVVEALVPAANEAVSDDAAVAAYLVGLWDWSREHLPVDHRLADLLLRVVDAADAGALPLFAGWRAAVRPIDASERVGHGLMLLRELRGGLHFAALRAAGLTIPEAVVLDPDGGRSRLLRTAWRPEVADRLIAGVEARPHLAQAYQAAQRATDDRVDEVLAAALDDRERAELVRLLFALT